jgi:hypothetical protein
MGFVGTSLLARAPAFILTHLFLFLQERSSLAALVEEARGIEEDIRLVRAESKKQTVQLSHDQFLREAQCIKLVRELRTIYPITLDSQKGYLIRNLRLPVDIYTTMVPEEEISAALGFCSHLIFLMSKYLSVQLRYRIFCNSSRSAIQQDGAALYPLFTARSIEREQLDRGLTLLGANVDCILMTNHIDYTPKSHILARLKRIYDDIIDGDAPTVEKGIVQ